MVIHLIVTRYISYAIGEGVRNWDVAWSKVASVILQSALASRCGDILLAEGYDAKYCLTWEHIDVRFAVKTSGIDPADLVMVADLQFEKHDKFVGKISLGLIEQN